MKKDLKTLILVLAGIWIMYLLVKIFMYGKERMESPFKYFNWSEFDSPDKPGSGKEQMNEAFIHKLDAIREEAGFPFIITSGYRTPAHNAKVGGVPNSSHVKGLAVDIAAVNIPGVTDARERIAKAAIRNGITRIGWGNTFIHLDIDPDKTQNIVWGYNNSYPSFSDLTESLA